MIYRNSSNIFVSAHHPARYKNMIKEKTGGFQMAKKETNIPAVIDNAEALEAKMAAMK